jgi:arginine deiminase
MPTDIITHCPTIETQFPYHLAALLYEAPPNPDHATECHNNFRKVLAELTGAKVWTVREILRQFPLEKLLEQLLSFSTVTFDIRPGNQQDREKFSTDYVRKSLSRLQQDNLIDLILLRPRVVINADESQTGFRYGQIPLQPLANLTFTRDQQITTARGVVIGRFGAVQRLPENELMCTVWPQIGVNPIGTIRAPGTLEGGDFIPVSKDIAMVGVGLRTNFFAAKQLMDEDLLGTRRFLIVEDLVDHNQQRMHLDTFFNLCDEKLCVCLADVADDRPRFKRTAREFVRHDNGTYEELKPIAFGEWLKKEKYTIVKASHQQQAEYFLNFLHLGKDKNGRGTILAINPDVEKAITDAGFVGRVKTIDFKPIMAMYGGVHCASQVLRKPLDL